MKYLLISSAFLMTIGSQSISAEHNFSNEDCDGLYEGIVSLLGEADNNWQHSGTEVLLGHPTTWTSR